MKDKLAEAKSFEFIDFGLPEDLGGDDVLSVKKDAFWSYCGPLLSKPDDLPSNLHDWAGTALSGPLLPLVLPLLAFVNDFVAANGLTHYWLTIRATKATAEFDRPRWHTDDLFFSRNSDSAAREGKTKKRKLDLDLDLQTDWKLCATLLGPATMFIPPEHQAAARATSASTKQALSTDHPCTSIRCVGCAATADAVRTSLADKFAPLNPVQAAPGECSVFRIGSERGAVHSEPSMSKGDRIFVNVVPGKEDELTALVAKWGMSFPRSWWIAPGVVRGRE
ncbi:hypothetical protein GGS26DRAFT_204584 [Hypomontagnella submonticulosa]|nr:hypothetical protein GGS26DRAFT_204584 [Hypomontagnella submonticulosa]